MARWRQVDRFIDRSCCSFRKSQRTTMSALLVGLLISILQVVTSIQEMTLTFVPKILAVGAVMLLFGHWMLTTLANYSTALISNIPSYF